MRPVNIALLGLGIVGCGTVNVLKRNAQEISRRAGRDVAIKYAVVNDLTKTRDCDTSNFELITDPTIAVTDPDIDIVIELIGGVKLAKQAVFKAIQHKKHIITANKALIAQYGNEIFAEAQKQGVIVAFEAAVAGGIPIIKTIREGLAGNRIEWVAGIINGTCNFILSAMQQHGDDFESALAEAQRRGFAEADPSFDIGGIDVAHKLTILASIAFGIPLQFESVYIEGIENISAQDILYAQQLGYVIKHLGITRRVEEGIELRVHPTLIAESETLAHVNGEMNALQVKGDAVGPTLYYGAGAGAEPTASSVIGDLVDVVRTLTTDPNNRVPHLAFKSDALQKLPILSMEQVETAYYVRMNAEDKPGVLADITRIFGEQHISIESILQKESEQQDGYVPIVIITHQVVEKNMQKALQQIETLPQIQNEIIRIRLEHL